METNDTVSMATTTPQITLGRLLGSMSISS